jgi:poly-gamma-glutamate synthesis protein (capsule biosynthesis protein)
LVQHVASLSKATLGGIFFFAVGLSLSVSPSIAQSAPVSRSTTSFTHFIAATRNRALIEVALAKERPAVTPPATVSGITAPHHLLAADLIARAVWAASGRRYARIVLLSPDHFGALRAPFGVTTAPLDTVMGTLAHAAEIADALLSDARFVDIGTAPNEHGIHSVTPFIKAVFPDARIAAVTTRTGSGPADWRRAVELLASVIGPETLIVQSTDYSHHLPVSEAVLRDQETLSAIAAHAPDIAERLVQGPHLDSRASQVMQALLQRLHYRSTPVVIANRNSVEYASAGSGGTTSYIVTVFVTEPKDGARFRYDDQDSLYLAGDVFTGRGFVELLLRPAAAERIVSIVRSATGGGPLVVNLEGAILNERPIGASPIQHVIPRALTLDLLRRLGVTAASLANNHAYDFGADGVAETERALKTAGIAALKHGTISDLGSLRILPLTFKHSLHARHKVYRTSEQVAKICHMQARPPLLVFAHWGDEYTGEPSAKELEAGRVMSRCGVSAIVGAHSHQASARVIGLGGGPRNSSSHLET